MLPNALSSNGISSNSILRSPIALIGDYYGDSFKDDITYVLFIFYYTIFMQIFKYWYTETNAVIATAYFYYVATTTITTITTITIMSPSSSSPPPPQILLPPPHHNHHHHHHITTTTLTATTFTTKTKTIAITCSCYHYYCHCYSYYYTTFYTLNTANNSVTIDATATTALITANISTYFYH